MGPIDYTSAFGAPADPSQGLLQGLQVGTFLRESKDKALAQQQAAEQKAAYARDVNALFQNPNPSARDYAELTVKYPQLKDQFKQSYELMSEDQKKNKASLMTQAFSALSTGRPDIAEGLLRDQATAMRNSGASEQEIKSQEMWADLIKDNPQQAQRLGGIMLASLDPDKFSENFGKLGAEQRASDMAPSQLARSEAEAQKAGVDAKFAEQSSVLDLQKKGWDIRALQEDINLKREANRIAAMNAATSREGNDLKRQELSLKVQEARIALDDKIRAKVADAESSATAIDNSLNTIESIKKNRSLDSVLGAVQGRLPAVVSDEANDAIALIDTLGSQAFLSQVSSLKGQGALSDAEGKKLQAALTNLSRTQSEKQFRSNLDEASRLLKKGRETLAKRTGVPLGSPDTPSAPGARPPLSSFESQ